ncbi:hypothetical protein [[Mycoplasma] gypis]|uniref:Asp23/Gls24 family envelope stress response protein n=1 Tax=[Mycoplasma] gypis TaxID=92404 RepID=A0ABZ2RUC1_9BACT|nr:hypothetical protein [[Mycoplasma] gypis]MBN0919535.1 hypothetical protein [[Mycoplasma] gypis]
MKKESIKEQLITIISSVVGIVGFASLNLNEEVEILDSNYEKGIEISIDNNQINLTIAVVILSSVSAKGIIEEISQNISYVLSKEKMTLTNLNIFIRGIE